MKIDSATASGWALAAAMAAAITTPAAAQTTPPPPPADQAAEGPVAPDGEDIIVTGRAGSSDRTKLETSYAVTTLNNDALRSRAASSVTETLKSVPGFWVEASGGEGSGNVRARGIPIDGFGSINLLEDGLPVQHDPALGFLNADQAFRIDETIERVEVVRGGPASVFEPNAPGGVVNYISRRPGDTVSGNARILYGPTADLFRIDGWFGGPLGNGFTLDMGGFWRDENGVRDPGFTGNQGGQGRITLAKEFDGGRVSLGYKRLADNAIFYAGIPLTKDAEGDITGIAGFDPRYGTTASRATRYLTLRSADGPVQFDNTDGTEIRLDQFSALSDFDFGDGWNLSAKARYRDSRTVRNGVFPVAVNTAANFIAANRTALLAAYPGATDVLLRYTDGSAFDIAGQNGNGLVFSNAARPVTVEESEFLANVRLSREFELFGQTHDISVGVYYANIDETFTRYSAVTLQDVSDNSRLLDLFAVDATGNILGAATLNGVSRFGSEFANGTGTQDTIAVYASDEWQVTDALRIDGGVRWEKVSTQGQQEGTATVNLGDPATLADNTVLTGNGVFTPFDREYDRTGFTIGADYRFASRAGVFARYTSAFRLPSVGSFITNATADPRVQGIKMYEAGFKYSDRLLSLYATGFLTDFDSFGIGNTQFNPVTGLFTTQTIFTDTRAYGVELEATVRPVSWFDFTLQATYQEPEFRNLRFTELVAGAPVDRDYTGNQLLRVPKLALRATPAVTLLDERLRVQADVEHYTERFADAANTSQLPAYTVLNASAKLQVTDRIALWAYGDNLTNTIGLTEGNPRAGELTSGQANDLLFVGRPIFGRNVRFAVDFKF